MEQAPNEFFWYCNERVDSLAAKAREKFSLRQLQNRPPTLWKGTKAICCIEGQYVNNNLYLQLQERIMGGRLKRFLIEKYGWTDSIFENISWAAHHAAIKQYPILKRPTLVKYIHGWLATTKRRSREGFTRDAGCPLCAQEDSKYHFLWCTNVQLNTLRELFWKQLASQIAIKTAAGCSQVFLAGLGTTRGAPPPTDHTIQEWPPELQEAYSHQCSIGWDQVLLGRLSISWEKVAAVDPPHAGNFHSHTWTKTIIRLGWTYGMDLWKARNAIIHGTEGPISASEIQRTQLLVKVMYAELVPGVQERRQDIAPLSEAEMLRQPHQSQCAWLEQLKYLFPVRFGSLAEQTVGKMRTDRDAERFLMRKTGQIFSSM